MPDLTFSMPVVEVLNECSEICAARHHEFETPEHLLLALIRQDLFREAYQSCGGNAQKLEEALNDYLDEKVSQQGVVRSRMTHLTFYVQDLAQKLKTFDV